METLQNFPLGATYPDSPHAVISCLPTMADVRGYKEKDPRVTAAMASGYPRFVTHAWVRRLIEYYLKQSGLSGRVALLVTGRRAADSVIAHLRSGIEKREVAADIYLVSCPETEPAKAELMQKYVQHTGCGISSRRAEDLLVECGLLETTFEESVYSGNAEQEAERLLADQIGCEVRDVLLCSSGMSAFYAAFRAVREYQREKSRSVWLQIGWLYLDSGVILREFLNEDERLVCLYDISDIDALIEQVRSIGDALAAVVVECPSNPLLQVCDLPRLAAAVREQGGVLMVDPTMASVYNVDVLPHADLLVTSLTKYAACRGDVMAGVLALNKESPHYGNLVLRTSAFHVPSYDRDLARLVYEMKEAPEIVAQINANAARLFGFLQQHSQVSAVHYAGNAEWFPSVARSNGAAGAVLSIELKGSMEAFYDAVRAIKGPSFGTYFTLLCPFIYLAHYDLVTADKGRDFLADVGIDPELIRISVGAEPYSEIEAVFAQALEVAAQ